MRLGILIRDQEYRKALTERISDYDNEILIDVIGASCSVEPDALIVTDAKPAELDTDLLKKIKDRTVFLTTQDLKPSNNCNLHNIFKYSSVSRLLADISETYYGWQGVRTQKNLVSKIIACCSDSDSFNYTHCSQLASQIIYNYGGSVMVLPLGYVNDYSPDFGRDINSFARLIYMLKSGREITASDISYTDSYGVSRLFIPTGRNPVAYLDGDDLRNLIVSMSKLFDTLVLDIGTCYREENLEAVRNSDSLLCFETGRRRVNFKGLLNIDKPSSMRTIRISEGTDEVFAMDEYIRELYGGRNEG